MKNRIDDGMDNYYNYVDEISKDLIEFYGDMSQKLSAAGVGVCHHCSSYTRPRYETLPAGAWEGSQADIDSTIVKTVFVVPGRISFCGVMLDDGNEHKYIINKYDRESNCDIMVSQCDSLNDLFLNLMMALSL